MPRPFWKGYLKLSLVTCPVAMTPATTEAAKVRFHTLSRKTGRRVESRYVDAETGKTVAPDDTAKAYAVGETETVILDDDDLDAVALESTRTIDIEMFVPRAEIAWVWFDQPHYLAPDDPVGEEAFAVIREAMAATKMVGIARLVLYRRERAVLLEPRDAGIVLWTLRFDEEVRSPDFDDIPKTTPDAEPLKLVKKLIAERTRDWNPEMVSDPVQERLLALIAAEEKGQPKKPAKVPEPETGGNVVNIMDALKKSLSSETGKKNKS